MPLSRKSVSVIPRILKNLSAHHPTLTHCYMFFLTVFLIVMFFCAAFLVNVCKLSFFEWYLHKNIMHKPFLGFFTYAFNAHAKVHHHMYKADHTYQTDDLEKAEKIPMAWWNGPVLILFTLAIDIAIPIVLYYLAQHNHAPSWMWKTYVASTVLASVLYFATYEYIHWCMHLPEEKKERMIQRSSIFRWLNGHHLLHHLYMHKNFNVVCPLADWCLGTLVLRAKASFPQAQGVYIPDVQPLVPSKPADNCKCAPSFGKR